MTIRALSSRCAVAAAFVLAFAPLLIRAQEQAAQAPQSAARAVEPNPTSPRPITLADYPRFKRLANQTISNDGKWMLYTVTPNEGDGTLFIQSLDSSDESTKSRAARAPASRTTRAWSAYFIPPPAATGRNGRGGNGRGGGGRADTQATGQGATPPARAFEVLDLTTGKKTSLPGGREFRVFARRRVAAAAAAEPDARCGGRQRAGRTRRRPRRAGAPPAAETRRAPTC